MEVRNIIIYIPKKYVGSDFLLQTYLNFFEIRRNLWIWKIAILPSLLFKFLDQAHRHNLCYRVGLHHWKYGCRLPHISKLTLRNSCESVDLFSLELDITTKITLSELMEELRLLSTGVEHGVVARQTLIAHLKQHCRTSIPSDTCELEHLVEDVSIIMYLCYLTTTIP